MRKIIVSTLVTLDGVVEDPGGVALGTPHLERASREGLRAQIKEQAGRDILMYGSPMLMRSLLQHGLVDQLDLMLCPIVIGQGQRLFGDGGSNVELTLAGHTDLATGVVILSYQPRAVSTS